MMLTLGIVNKVRCAARIAVPLLVAAMAISPAHAYPHSVEGACKDDYFRFCAIYPLQSASLRQCKEAKAGQLNPTCKKALIDAGYVDRRRLKR